MPRRRTAEENLKGFIRSLEILKVGINTYNQGHLVGWQLIPTELCKLLIDRQSGPLVKHLFPDLELHPMINGGTPDREGIERLLLYDPVVKHFEPDNLWVEIFDETQPTISLSEWLKQVFLVCDEKYLTIADYVKYLRDTYCSHHALEVENRQDSLDMWVITIQGRVQSSIEMYTVAIGDYVLRQLLAKLGKAGFVPAS